MRTEVGRGGDDGPVDLAQRVHGGEESPGVGMRCGLDVLLPGQAFRAVELVGHREDRWTVRPVDRGD